MAYNSGYCRSEWYMAKSTGPRRVNKIIEEEHYPFVYAYSTPATCSQLGGHNVASIPDTLV